MMSKVTLHRAANLLKRLGGIFLNLLDKILLLLEVLGLLVFWVEQSALKLLEKLRNANPKRKKELKKQLDTGNLNAEEKRDILTKSKDILTQHIRDGIEAIEE